MNHPDSLIKFTDINSLTWSMSIDMIESNYETPNYRNINTELIIQYYTLSLNWPNLYWQPASIVQLARKLEITPLSPPLMIPPRQPLMGGPITEHHDPIVFPPYYLWYRLCWYSGSTIDIKLKLVWISHLCTNLHINFDTEAIGM